MELLIKPHYKKDSFFVDTNKHFQNHLDMTKHTITHSALMQDLIYS